RTHGPSSTGGLARLWIQHICELLAGPNTLIMPSHTLRSCEPGIPCAVFRLSLDVGLPVEEKWQRQDESALDGLLLPGRSAPSGFIPLISGELLNEKTSRMLIHQDSR